MMFLSKVTVPWKTAREPYQWHKAVWSLFPGRADAERQFLFRIEENSPGRSAAMLLLSQCQPESSTDSTAQVLAARAFAPDILAGQILRFRLVANPVRCIRDEGGRLGRDGKPKSCRVPILTETARVDWLTRKLERAATLETVIAVSQPPLYFRKPGQAPGKIVPVRYDGVMRVQLPTALLAQVHVGIGPAKSFGCGLMSFASA